METTQDDSALGPNYWYINTGSDAVENTDWDFSQVEAIAEAEHRPADFGGRSWEELTAEEREGQISETAVPDVYFLRVPADAPDDPTDLLGLPLGEFLEQYSRRLSTGASPDKKMMAAKQVGVLAIEIAQGDLVFTLLSSGGLRAGQVVGNYRFESRTVDDGDETSPHAVPVRWIDYLFSNSDACAALEPAAEKVAEGGSVVRLDHADVATLLPDLMDAYWMDRNLTRVLSEADEIDARVNASVRAQTETWERLLEKGLPGAQVRRRRFNPRHVPDTALAAIRAVELGDQSSDLEERLRGRAWMVDAAIAAVPFIDEYCSRFLVQSYSFSTAESDHLAVIYSRIQRALSPLAGLAAEFERSEELCDRVSGKLLGRMVDLTRNIVLLASAGTAETSSSAWIVLRTFLDVCADLVRMRHVKLPEDQAQEAVESRLAISNQLAKWWTDLEVVRFAQRLYESRKVVEKMPGMLPFELDERGKEINDKAKAKKEKALCRLGLSLDSPATKPERLPERIRFQSEGPKVKLEYKDFTRGDRLSAWGELPLGVKLKYVGLETRLSLLLNKASHNDEIHSTYLPAANPAVIMGEAIRAMKVAFAPLDGALEPSIELVFEVLERTALPLQLGGPSLSQSKPELPS
jgi:hypothetical protein